MKQNDVKVGEQYLTKIGEKRVAVKVTAEAHSSPYSKAKRFWCRRVDTGRDLPKPRTAAALRGAS